MAEALATLRWWAIGGGFVAGNSVIAATLNALGLPGTGLVVCFWLFSIPAGLFAGFVLGRTFRLGLWSRVGLTAVVASTLSRLYF